MTNRPIKVTIASDHKASQALQNKINKLVADNGFSSQAIFAVKLALEEAMTNAIKHGNRLDPHKKVHVEYLVTPERFEVMIEDEGPGFNREGVPDPTADENIHKCSGRGILLMEAYMSSVAYDRNGRRLRMSKLNEPDVHPHH